MGLDDWVIRITHWSHFSQMASELTALPCLLLMEFVRGRPLLECVDAFEASHVRGGPLLE